MSILHPSKSLRVQKYDNQAIIEKAFCIDDPTKTYAATCNASTDPFTSKTNKYAECKLIRVILSTLGAHIRFGESTIGAATTDDYYLAPNIEHFFAINDAKPYCRIIGASGTPKFFVTELN